MIAGQAREVRAVEEELKLKSAEKQMMDFINKRYLLDCKIDKILRRMNLVREYELKDVNTSKECGSVILSLKPNTKDLNLFRKYKEEKNSMKYNIFDFYVQKYGGKMLLLLNDIAVSNSRGDLLRYYKISDQGYNQCHLLSNKEYVSPTDTEIDNILSELPKQCDYIKFPNENKYYFNK